MLLDDPYSRDGPSQQPRITTWRKKLPGENFGEERTRNRALTGDSGGIARAGEDSWARGEGGCVA